jgi:hypothetical protein
MELTLLRETAQACRRFTLSTASKVDPAGVFSATNPTEVVIWADAAFVFDIGTSPATTLPSEATPGDVVWPANVPARIVVPAGHRIAAATVTGTGNLVICPGV